MNNCTPKYDFFSSDTLATFFYLEIEPEACQHPVACIFVIKIGPVLLGKFRICCAIIPIADIKNEMLAQPSANTQSHLIGQLTVAVINKGFTQNRYVIETDFCPSKTKEGIYYHA